MATVLNTAFRRFLHSSAQRAANSAQIGPSATHGHGEGSYKIWKNLSLFVFFPAIALCGVNVYLMHQKKDHTRPEFIKYDYLRIRSKRFPWGDGNHSLFHNPHFNPLPDGYEEVEGHH